MIAMSAEAEQSTGLRRHTGGEEPKRGPATAAKLPNRRARSRLVQAKAVDTQRGEDNRKHNSKGRPPPGEQTPTGNHNGENTTTQQVNEKWWVYGG